MAEHITIGALTITGDLQWVDEYTAGSDLVGQAVAVSITGTPIYQASAQLSGRKLTLQGRREGSNAFGVITRAEVEALRALAATPGATFSVTLTDNRVFSARFSRDDGPAVEAEPLKHIWPPEDGDLYLPTIRLVLV